MSSVDIDGEEAVMMERDEQMDIEEQQQQTKFDISDLGNTIKVASEEALAVKTVGTYRRYINAFYDLNAEN